MSNTPDLDRAKEAVQLCWAKFTALSPTDFTVDVIALLILEQRAEEAERCAKTYSCFDVDGRSYVERAARLRSQIGGKP